MITKIFYYSDEFCKFFNKIIMPSGKNHGRKSSLLDSEVITICILFHRSGYKTFKDFYTKCVLVSMKKYFNKLVSYNRFVELKNQLVVPLFVFSSLCKRLCTGTSFIDSTKLSVSNNKRGYSNKTFNGSAKWGHTSMGKFYGFKLHLVISEAGEVVDFIVTEGNTADNNRKLMLDFSKNLFGKLVGDKGYIGTFKYMFDKGVSVIHKIRSNMKNKLLSLEDKLLLQKRGIIESVFGIMKEELSLEHSRHRSKNGFLSHIFSTLLAYTFRPKKPHIRLYTQTINA